MRRTTWALVVGFIIGITGSCTGRVPAPCTACNDVCVDVKVDSSNCGACGTKCAAGFVCAGGSCVASCPVTQTACDGGCFDVQVDPRHCGVCGRGCTAGFCRDGMCQGAQTCLPPLSDCSGQCVDTASNTASCGACGRACDAGYCVRGACQAVCPLSVCGAACVDTKTDPSNCGACGTGCGLGFCRDGGCESACQAPLLACPTACVDPRNDPQACGACGASCDGGYCVNRACRSTCPAPFTTCGGACVDTANDARHCGGCNAACNLPNTAATACSNGACSVASCLPGFVDCDGVGANGCESVEGCVQPVTIGYLGGMANDPALIDVYPFGVAARSPLRRADVSDDGRVIAFITVWDQVTANDTNGLADVFVRDTVTGVTTNITQGANGPSRLVAVSGDGRWVAFVTAASNLEVGDNNGREDIYVYDLITSGRTRVSLSADGGSIDRDGYDGIDISYDGALIVFTSVATNLVEPALVDPAVVLKVFRLDRATRRAELLYQPPQPTGGTCNVSQYQAFYPRASSDGRTVTFSTAVKVVTPDINDVVDQYVILPDAGFAGASVQQNGNFATNQMCAAAGTSGDVSGNGRVVVFYGTEDLTGAGDGLNDTFARDLISGRTTRVSGRPDGGQLNGEGAYAVVDGAGRRVVYVSNATNQVMPPPPPGPMRCFIADLYDGGGLARTLPLAVALGGEYPRCFGSKISGNGKAILFATPDPLSLRDVAQPPDGGGMDLYLRYVP